MKQMEEIKMNETKTKRETVELNGKVEEQERQATMISLIKEIGIQTDTIEQMAYDITKVLDPCLEIEMTPKDSTYTFIQAEKLIMRTLSDIRFMLEGIANIIGVEFSMPTIDEEKI